MLLAVLIVFGMFTAQGLGGTMLSALAMDQEAVCGMEEHVHSDSCYSQWDILQCGQTAHTHTSSCYMVLLEDNNINTLLEEVDEAEDHSLTNLVAQTMALDAASGSDSAQNTGRGASSNGENARSTLVLNSSLTTAADLESSAANGGISTLAVGDDAKESGQYLNFYVRIDNTWTSIGSLQYSRDGKTAYVSTSSIVNLVNSSLGTSYNRNDFKAYYSTRSDGKNARNAALGSSTTTFGNNSGIVYVHLVGTTGYNWSNTGFSFYTVTYNYPDGSSETQYIRSGTAVTLPPEYTWEDNYGNVYDGDDSVTITRATIFTAEDEGTFVIRYNVNFPDEISGVTVTAEPTVMGESVHADPVDEGSIATIHTVSQMKVEGSVNGADNGLSRVIQFRGWRVGNTDEILQPGVSLTWDDLQTYGRRLTLNGIWEYDARQTVSFFVSYASAVLDSNGNVITDTSFFTPEIFNAFLEGEDTLNLSVSELDTKYNIETDGSDASTLEADKNIRKLTAVDEDGVWMTSFPDDEYVFQQLQQYADDLSVDGTAVRAEDLNDNGYAIRWYVFKSQSDAWHVDGILVRKEGQLEVTKSFAGNKDAINTIKDNGFCIEAASGERTVNLTLTEDSYESYDEETNKYTWLIEDVTYGEQWSLTEQNYGDAFAEYIIVDASGEQSSAGRYTGAPVTVTGMTYATDLGEAEVLSVEFTNIYKGQDSLVIKKEDSQTSRPLEGAGFKLIQNGQPLTFIYDSVHQVYTASAAGTVTELKSASGGYLEIAVTGLDFEQGDITVHESTVPSGYAGWADVILTKETGQDVQISAGSNAEMDNGVLIIGNSPEVQNIAVEKLWSKEDDKQEVTLQLLANGRLASTLVSGITAEVVLNDDNNYQYIWQNMPQFANGNEITWSVREVQIGSEKCKSDYTFSNWMVDYAPSVITENDGERTVTLAVTNTKRAGTMLRLIKTDLDGARLSGAAFKLEMMDPQDSTQVYTGFTPVEQTTDVRGMLTFSSLPFGQYRLTETNPPAGYDPLTESVYLTLHDTGIVSVQSGSATVYSATDLTIQIANRKSGPLPETGGSNNHLTAYCGIMLMLLSAVTLTYSYILRRRKVHK